MQAVQTKRWQVRETIPQEVRQTLSDYPPVLQQLLYNRNVRTLAEAEQYLGQEGSFYDPFLLLDMRPAVDRILQAIDRHEEVVVYGDYDVDGVTATALLVQVIRSLGGEARGYIPNRFDEGYGLNLEALDNLAADGVRVVVTVDCGIRSPREADRARELGIDLIISDHHEPRETLPQCLAVICPKRTGDTYPDRDLAGVGLAFKIAEGLFQTRTGNRSGAAAWLDLVAVGTVADIVPLRGENRGMVRAGLRLLRKGQRQGLVSLAGAANLESTVNLTARDIGFVIGPRLNAAGRLESALAAYDLLMATRPDEAAPLALRLDSQNRQRQEITTEIQAQAEQLALGDGAEYLLLAVKPEFNMGVVGLAAARLVETFYRPAIVGYHGDGFIRASCRSIPEFHITHALDECADLLVRHGGHSMAAGFTIDEKNLPEFSKKMMDIAARELSGKDLRPQLMADLDLPLVDLKPEILRFIDFLEPTGQLNPEVTFITRNVRVNRFRKVGKENNHLKLTITDGRILYDAVAFRQGHWADDMPERIDILYSFEKNVFNGRENLQLNVKDLRPAAVL